MGFVAQSGILCIASSETTGCGRLGEVKLYEPGQLADSVFLAYKFIHLE